MGCGVTTGRAKISCLRLLVGFFNFLLGVSCLLITFDHFYRPSHLGALAGLTPPDILMKTEQAWSLYLRSLHTSLWADGDMVNLHEMDWNIGYRKIG